MRPAAARGRASSGRQSHSTRAGPGLHSLGRRRGKGKDARDRECARIPAVVPWDDEHVARRGSEHACLPPPARRSSHRLDARRQALFLCNSEAFGLGKGTHSGCIFSRDCDVVGTSERRVTLGTSEITGLGTPRDSQLKISQFSYQYFTAMVPRFHSNSPKAHSEAVKPWSSRILSLAAAHHPYSYP